MTIKELRKLTKIYHKLASIRKDVIEMKHLCAYGQKKAIEEELKRIDELLSQSMQNATRVLDGIGGK